LATQQHGAVKHGQLLQAGIGPSVIKRLTRAGALHRRHQGVYIVGHLALAPFAKEAAASLACREGAVISHRSAARLWGFLDPEPSQVDVTVIGGWCRPKRGIRIHRVAAIDDRDLRRRHGLPVISPAQTLIDLAAESTMAELEDAVAEARSQRLIRKGELEASVERAGRRRGAARMRHFLRAEGGPEITRSRAERRFRALLREAQLPQPRLNVRIGRFTVDFLWEREHVALEVDSWQFHGHRRAFERDRRKDLALSDAGYHVIRITWRQFTEESLPLIAHISRALDRAARPHG
jgi:very-short-patch-repair endonuclease